MAPKALTNTADAAARTLDRPVATVNGYTVRGKHVLVAAVSATLLTVTGLGVARAYRHYRRRWKRELAKRAVQHEREKLAERLNHVKEELDQLLDGDLKLMHLTLDKIDRRTKRSEDDDEKDDTSSSSSSSDDDEEEEQKKSRFFRREARRLRRSDSQSELRKRFGETTDRLNLLMRQLDHIDSHEVEEKKLKQEEADKEKSKSEHGKLRHRVRDELHSLKQRFGL